MNIKMSSLTPYTGPLMCDPLYCQTFTFWVVLAIFRHQAEYLLVGKGQG